MEVDVTADRPVAMLAARLSDVAPEGHATRVSYGLLNLTHRDGHADPQPLVPGQRYRVRVVLNGMAHAFPAGHRIRLALSTSYWPLAWAPPEPVHLQVHLGASRLLLPQRPAQAPDDVSRQPFGEPEGAAPLSVTQVLPGEHRWTVTRDLVDYDSSLDVVNDLGVVRIDDIDVEVTRRADERYTSTADDVTSVSGRTSWHMGFRRGSWNVHTRTTTVLACTATHFELTAELDAYESGRRVLSRNWQRRIRRDHV